MARTETASIWAKVGRELKGTGGGGALSPPFPEFMAGIWTGSDVVFGRVKAVGGGGRRRGSTVGPESSIWIGAGEFTGRDGSRGGKLGLAGG